MFNPNIVIGNPFTVQSVYLATTAYTAGTVFSMDTHNALGLEITYTKGNETSMEAKIEVSNDGGTVYAQESTESTSGGTVTTSLGARSFSATGVYSVLVTPLRAKLVKVSSKTTFGTVSTGSVTIKAYPLWV